MNKTTLSFAIAGSLAVLALAVGLPNVPRPVDPPPRPPPPSRTDGSLTLESRLSHPFVETGVSDVFLTLDLKGAEVPGATRAPVNLAVVIDRSGSMYGQKLEQAKQAAKHLVRQLRESDRLTLINYGSDVRTLSALAATGPNQSRMLQFIDAIRDEGGTNIGAALATAEQQVHSGVGDYKVNRVILITDGQPTEGMTDGRALVGLVQRIRAEGINVSAIGVGADFNENLLQQFAEYGAGSYGFLEDTSQLATLFQRDLQQAGTTVARNVALSVELPPGVELQEVMGHRFEQIGGAVKIPMTDFSAGQVERVVARLTLHAGAAGQSLDVAKVHAAYDDLVHGGRGDSNATLAAMVTREHQEVIAKQDKDVALIAARAVAASNMIKAADALEAGDVSSARGYVQQNEAVFGAVAGIADAKGLREAKEEFAPAPAAFAATPAAEVQVAAKRAKASALKGLGRMGSTF